MLFLALSVKGLHAGVDDFAGSARAGFVLRLEFAIAQLVVVDEKTLDLLEQMRTQIPKALKVLMGLRVYCHGEQAIVPRPLFSLVLLHRLDDAEKLGPHDAPGHNRRIHQNQDVERVAILAERRRHEAEVAGKDHAFRQHGAKLKAIAFRIVVVLVAAPLRRLDDDTQFIVLLGEGRDFRKDRMTCRTWRHGRAVDNNYLFRSCAICR